MSSSSSRMAGLKGRRTGTLLRPERSGNAGDRKVDLTFPFGSSSSTEAVTFDADGDSTASVAITSDGRASADDSDSITVCPTAEKAQIRHSTSTGKSFSH